MKTLTHEEKIYFKYHQFLLADQAYLYTILLN